MKKSIAWIACAGLLTLVGCATEKTTTTTTTTEKQKGPTAKMDEVDRTRSSAPMTGPPVRP